jgi:hypothetical protein
MDRVRVLAGVLNDTRTHPAVCMLPLPWRCAELNSARQGILTASGARPANRGCDAAAMMSAFSVASIPVGRVRACRGG